MKVLRTTVLVATVVAATLLPAMAATAEVHEVAVTSPEAGTVFESDTARELEVAVTWNGERPDRVEVRLVGANGAPVAGTEPVSLTTCRGECPELVLAPRTSTWVGQSLQPRTLAPFASDSTPRCNGAYGLQARVPGADGWQGGTGVVVSLAPSAPSAVTVTPGPGRATLSWDAAPQPDVVGYTVQRRTRASGGWDTVTEVGPGTTEVTDGDAPSGTVEYRVTTFRGDGFRQPTSGGDDEPAPACADDGRDLATAAGPVATTVPAPSGSASEGGSASPDGAGSTDADDPGAAPSDDGTAEGDDGTAGPAGGGNGAEGEADGTAPDPSPRRRASAPSIGSGGERSEVSVPDLATPSASRTSPGETYFGEGEEYSQELDFGDLDTSAASGEGVAGEVSLGVPGGLQGVLGERMALRRVLGPVAGGMVLLGFGLHLRRWLHDPVD